LATCFQDAAATLGAHPAQKTVLAFPTNFGWLISSFHTNCPDSKYIYAKCNSFGLNKILAKLAKNRAGKHTNSHSLVKRVKRKLRYIQYLDIQASFFGTLAPLIQSTKQVWVSSRLGEDKEGSDILPQVGEHILEYVYYNRNCVCCTHAAAPLYQ